MEKKYMPENYNLLSENRESTVVACYERETAAREASFQSEADMERGLIEQLVRQGYEYLPLHNEGELIANLRRQIERLNRIELTDGEWQRLLRSEIANEGHGIEQKTFTLQRDSIKALELDDGTLRNIRLIDRHDIHANSTQVINQYQPAGGKRANRYDVTILVNGLPMVHIELKRRGVALKEAFNQINRYGRESFWAGSGLFEYVQLFVISNGTETKYYSNTTRAGLLREKNSSRQRTSASYEFTSYWSDARNHILGDIDDFGATFLSRHTLLSVLTRYCVLTEQRQLLAMRPYQIAATERLLSRIEIAHNARQWGTREACGYIWHTTGSGKTLTSFKAAQLAVELPYVEKVLFVVDRKDLDYQTMREYDRFQRGAANGNTSTRELEAQIESQSSQRRLIITTIQKLSNYVRRNPQSPIYGREVVMIFDECHRSQFGEMHSLIARRFKRYYMFGFTGTPIFAENIAASGGTLRTTEDVFGRRLHAYTIVSAIRDRNVLPFRVDYVSTMHEKEEVENCPVWDIEREQALMDPRRIEGIARYILEHFDQQTKRARSYALSSIANIESVAADRRKSVAEERRERTVRGFNSILAVQSIEMARAYYGELKRQIALLPEEQRLRIALIYSYAPNEAEADENSDSTEGLDQSSRDYLEAAIQDYNRMFHTNYDTTANSFGNYYKDVSMRMKNREIDLLVVVNMFLTGFDATTLNTLWVDKSLRYHGLLQAYSRTNRILNSIKTFGNIVCFRNLEEATNRCIALFGDEDARSITILRPYADYMHGYDNADGQHTAGYVEHLHEMTTRYRPGEMPLGETAEKDYIARFGTLLRMRNVLQCFDQFANDDPLTERDLQDYTSIYLTLADRYRREPHDATAVNDDIVFEIELVKQVEYGIDQILSLVQQYGDSHKTDAELLIKIAKAISASPDLRDKRELIEQFIEQLTPNGDTIEAWREYIDREKRRQLQTIIAEEQLRPAETLELMENAFERGSVPEGGMELDSIMPPLNPFDPSARRQERIERVIERLKAFFDRFHDIASPNFTDEESI